MQVEMNGAYAIPVMESRVNSDIVENRMEMDLIHASPKKMAWPNKHGLSAGRKSQGTQLGLKPKPSIAKKPIASAPKKVAEMKDGELPPIQTFEKQNRDNAHRDY